MSAHEGTLPVPRGWRKPPRHVVPDLRGARKSRVMPPAPTKAEIVAAYEAGASSYKVAAQFGVSHWTVINYAIQAGVPIRRPGPVAKPPKSTAPVETARARMERWTVETNAAPSPWTDAVLDRVIADIRELEKRLGLPESPLP